jgi:hypothetical protein
MQKIRYLSCSHFSAYEVGLINLNLELITLRLVHIYKQSSSNVPQTAHKLCVYLPLESESNHHALQPRQMLRMWRSENILKLTDSLHWHVQSTKYKNHNKNIHAYVTLANTYSENAVKVEKKTKMFKEKLHREHKKMVLSKTNRSYQKKAVWYRCCFRENA